MTFLVLSVMVIKVYKRWIWFCNSIQYCYDNTHTPLRKFDQLFNLLLKHKSLIEMPSTRKQKAREKRLRQSDVMSDIENLDVMLGNYQESDQVRDENLSNTDFDLESRRPQSETNSISGNFRSLLNTNTSENSEITAETIRAITSEFSSQMSRMLEEMKSDLNSHILNAIDSAIEEKVIPSIKDALENQNSTENTNLDLRSDGPHPSTFSQVRPQRDLRSDGPHQQIAGKASQDVKKDFSRLVTMSSDQINHQRENSVVSYRSDDENGYHSS